MMMRGVVVALLGVTFGRCQDTSAFSGLDVKVYIGAFTDYPNFASLTPYGTFRGEVSLSADDQVDLRCNSERSRCAVQSTGYLTVTTSGIHTFSLKSGDYLRMFLDGETVIDEGGLGEKNLAIGEYEVRVEYLQEAVGDYLELEWKEPGDTNLGRVPKASLLPVKRADIAFVADGCLTQGTPNADPGLSLASAVRCCGNAQCKSDFGSEYSPTCYNSVSFTSAQGICADEGLRLCTRRELETDLCCSTGCGHDARAVWYDNCATNPCVHGTCASGLTSYTCTCETGYSGTNCDEEAV